MRSAQRIRLFATVVSLHRQASTRDGPAQGELAGPIASLCEAWRALLSQGGVALAIACRALLGDEGSISTRGNFALKPSRRLRPSADRPIIAGGVRLPRTFPFVTSGSDRSRPPFEVPLDPGWDRPLPARPRHLEC